MIFVRPPLGRTYPVYPCERRTGIGFVAMDFLYEEEMGTIDGLGRADIRECCGGQGPIRGWCRSPTAGRYREQRRQPVA